MTAVAIEIIYALLQTEPTPPDPGIAGVVTVLLITGAVTFTGAIWESKRQVGDIVVLILVVIGFAGIGMTATFHPALVNTLFPRLSIISFLYIDFMSIAMVGVFLALFNRLPRSEDRENLHKIEQANMSSSMSKGRRMSRQGPCKYVHVIPFLTYFSFQVRTPSGNLMLLE